MSSLKTQAHGGSVQAYLETLADLQQVSDCNTLLAFMQSLTGELPKMWGKILIGFGNYSYRQSGGKVCSWFLTGFGPRKGQISIYIMQGFDKYQDLMEKLGKYKTGVGCLYVKRLADVNPDILAELISRSYNDMKNKYAR